MNSCNWRPRSFWTRLMTSSHITCWASIEPHPYPTFSAAQMALQSALKSRSSSLWPSLASPHYLITCSASSSSLIPPGQMRKDYVHQTRCSDQVVSWAMIEQGHTGLGWQVQPFSKISHPRSVRHGRDIGGLARLWWRQWPSGSSWDLVVSLSALELFVIIHDSMRNVTGVQAFSFLFL